MLDLPSPLPETYEDLKTELMARYEQLPKRLKQVAAYAMNHPDDIALGTAASVAEAASVQPSTLVRFAQALGYSGFSDLQQIFRTRLRAQVPEHWERVRALRRQDVASQEAINFARSELRLLDGFMIAGHQSLDRMRETITPEAFNAAVDTLATARTIHIVAARRVFPVATYLLYAFGKLGIAAHCIDQIGAMGTEQISAAHWDDAILAMSFSPYAPTTVGLAQAALNKGVPVVSITDSPFSPLVPISKTWIELAETDYGAFRSLSATFALIMALAVAIADRRAQD